jgi:hypothetical protein
MSSTIGVQNISHTNGTNAMTIDSSGATTFTSDPFNSVIEVWDYGTTNESIANATVLSGWTRQTSGLFPNKNGGMSTSNGIWTFPSTGVWSASIQFNIYATGAVPWAGIQIYQTENNSSYADVRSAYTNIYANGTYSNLVMNYIVNITNTSNQKIKFQTNTASNVVVQSTGSASASTFVQFIKLCPSA